MAPLSEEEPVKYTSFIWKADSFPVVPKVSLFRFIMFRFPLGKAHSNEDKAWTALVV